MPQALLCAAPTRRWWGSADSGSGRSTGFSAGCRFYASRTRVHRGERPRLSALRQQGAPLRSQFAFLFHSPLSLLSRWSQVWQSMRFLISEMTRIGSSIDLKRHSIELIWDKFLNQKVSSPIPVPVRVSLFLIGIFVMLSKATEVPLLEKWILQRVAHLTQRFNASFEDLCLGQGCDEALHNCVSDLRLWWTENLCSVYLEVVKHRLRISASSITFCLNQVCAS